MSSKPNTLYVPVMVHHQQQVMREGITRAGTEHHKFPINAYRWSSIRGACRLITRQTGHALSHVAFAEIDTRRLTIVATPIWGVLRIKGDIPPGAIRRIYAILV